MRNSFQSLLDYLSKMSFLEVGDVTVELSKAAITIELKTKPFDIFFGLSMSLETARDLEIALRQALAEVD